MPTLQVRPFCADDIDHVMTVWQRANDLAHPFLTDDFLSKLEEDVRTLYVPNAETWVLEVEGTVAGFVSLLGNEIGGLFVDPSFHGQGYGKALVDHAVALKGPLTVEVFRDNQIGRPFYERYGFAFVCDELHAPSGQISRKMAMPTVR